MRFRAAAAGEGAAWTRDAFRAFGRQPLAFAAIFAACALGSLLLLTLPYIGWVALVVVWPAASLLFLIASRKSLAGERPLPGAVTELLAARKRLVELLKLGVCYLVCGIGASLLAGVLDGGAFASFVDTMANARGSTDAVAAKLADPALRTSVLIRATITALLSIPFWHAPALVFWGGQRWVKSLFFSTVALWRNRSAFLVYGLVWSALSFGFVIVLGLVAGLVGPAAGVAVAAPMLILFWTILYASLWFTFIGCFHLEPQETPSP